MKIIIFYILYVTISTAQNTVQTRFETPNGYTRISENENTFGTFLRKLPLKPANSLVKYYDGTYKNNDNIYAAVVNLTIGNKDLHQCADAVMRLRADFLYQQKRYNEIHFNFTNGMKVDFSKWQLGYRIKVKGNSTTWMKTTTVSTTYSDYWKYMEQIFQYAGTASLAKELKKIPISDLKIGDVFIKGGFPGHAVIIVDVAVKNNKKIFLLAQSYMPAQELQILQNPTNTSLSPWYDADFGTILQTPEWQFNQNELKRF
jgi:Domain of unknown function (4846)